MDIEYDEKSEDSMVFNHEKETCEPCKEKPNVKVTDSPVVGTVCVPRRKQEDKLC